MKYYKIIVDAQIVGVATSLQCFRFQAAHSMLQRTTDEKVEYIECSNTLYHAWWMKPIETDLYRYQLADVMEIEEQEYNILAPISEPIPLDEGEDIPEEPVIEPVDPSEEITIEFVRNAKINEMSRACRNTIESGFDLQVGDTMHHFSLTTQDQLNLMSLSQMAQTQSLIPYHADGESCSFYTSEEINQIVAAAANFKIYQTTYYNSLKDYINSLQTIEEISAIEYGIAIPEQYKSTALKILDQ